MGFLLTITVGSIIVQSCSGINDGIGENKHEFFKHLDYSTINVNYIKLKPKSATTEQKNKFLEETGTLYLYSDGDTFNEMEEEFAQINDFEQLIETSNEYDLILSTDYQEIIDYELNELFSYQVPIEPIESALQPSVIEAKKYLYTKGFTDQDIHEMIVEENGNELDLIPFVIGLASLEDTNTLTMDYPNLFISNAYAQTTSDFIRCGAIAIGADLLFSLGTSDATKWSKKAMKKAFGEVAKKALGPIGVAISVVTFSVCIAEAYLD